MNINYLFPQHFKKIGFLLFIPSALAGLFFLFSFPEYNFLNFQVPAIAYLDGFMSDSSYLGFTQNNFLDEIITIVLILSLLFIAFSREKIEDEFIIKLRMESLVWATYVNYAILILSVLFVYDIPFLNVLVINMFTILACFIIRFNWQISKLNNESDEE